jgi:uncharacterized protein YuzB (UPF0349 family)
MVTVEFCTSNLVSHGDQAKQRLMSVEGVRVKTFGCLGNCGQCFQRPYALVNDEVVEGDTQEELYRNILADLPKKTPNMT